MDSWLILPVIFLLTVSSVTSTPVPQSSVLLSLVPQTRGGETGLVSVTGRRIVLGPRRVIDLQTEHPRIAHSLGLLSGGRSNPEAMWPNGVFLPPDDEIQALLDIHNLGNSLVSEDEPDPLLLTGSQAVSIVDLLFSHGELFFDEVPHERALMLNQQERRVNGLDGNRLGSNRPESPFYRWSRRHNHRRRISSSF